VHNFDPNLPSSILPSYWFSGDGVSDTPAHAVATGWGPMNDPCFQLPENIPDTCPSLPGSDPISNFMNYLKGECYETYGEFTGTK